ncbi:MAG: competence/damage-inducible protein A [Thermomicrobiales bacterium]
MRASILSIGRELILGHITDTNATFLSQELVILGIELLHVVQVSDDRARITTTIRNSLKEAELIICTGGIGPTGDDLTREAIADVVGETPAVDSTLLATIEKFFAARGQAMPAQNQKQAWLIPGAESLPNPVGTAPGWFVNIDGKFVVCMPGVPREMTRMWSEQVVPRLRAHLPHRVLSSVRFKTIGIGESAAEQKLADLVALDNPVVATYAKDDGVHILVAAVADRQADAEALRDGAAIEVERRLTDFIYSANEITLADALIELLRIRKAMLVIEDRGGGGRFASLLQSSPRASLVSTYAVSLPHAASEDSMLSELMLHTGANTGIELQVTASPTENDLYEATVSVNICGEGFQVEESFSLRAKFEEVQRRSGMIAADVLHRALKASPTNKSAPEIVE